MRHHVHCKDLHGKVGYYPQLSQIDRGLGGDPNLFRKGLNTDEIVTKNTQVALGDTSPIYDFNKHQRDILAYTYPYHMQVDNCMKTYDCQPSNNMREDTSTIENKLKQFNLRHPLLQLRFNVHDYNHRPSCFTKGPECRTELPKRHTHVAAIHFDNDKCITWYFIDVSKKK